MHSLAPEGGRAPWAPGNYRWAGPPADIAPLAVTSVRHGCEGAKQGRRQRPAHLVGWWRSPGDNASTAYQSPAQHLTSTNWSHIAYLGGPWIFLFCWLGGRVWLCWWPCSSLLLAGGCSSCCRCACCFPPLILFVCLCVSSISLFIGFPRER